MPLTLIIPTLNAHAHVDAFCVALASQSRQPDRLLVLDSSSEDGSAALWRQRGFEVINIPRGEFDHGGTRNLGARLAADAGGPGIAVFLTQDAIMANPATLAALIEPLEDGRAAACFGRQLPSAGASNAERYARYFQYRAQTVLRSSKDLETPGVRAVRFSNVCSAVRLDKFWSVGGFPERTILNEDMLLAAKLLKAGEQVCYAASAEVIHSHDYSWKQQFRRNFDIGVSFSDAGELLEGVRTGGEGLQFAAGQLAYLRRLGKPDEMVPAAADLGARWLGFQLGRRHHFWPRSLKKRLSMHSYYWDQKRKK